MEKQIDDNTYKVLNYIFKYKNVEKTKIINQFKFDVKASMNILFEHSFITYSELGQIVYGEVIFNSSNIIITTKGKTYVQNQRQDKFRFRIPLIISTVALVLSVIALYRP